MNSGLWLAPAAMMLAGCAAPDIPVQQMAPARVAPAQVPVRATPSGRQDFSIDGELAQGGLARGIAPEGTSTLTLNGSPVRIGAGGAFLIGFGRDHVGPATLVARLADGREVRRELSIAARAWRIEHINTPRLPSPPTPAFLRMREGELARIAAARARSSDSQGWRQRFAWPARGRISGVFGSQRVYRGEAGAYHSGVDVAAGAGAEVAAPADGVVVLAGPPSFSLEGNLVIIDHGMGLSSAFLHLSRSDVREGQTVRQGQPVGAVGATGRATGPHLHWSLMLNGIRLDPQRVAGEMR